MDRLLVFVTDFQICYAIKGLENLPMETTRAIKFDDGSEELNLFSYGTD